MSEPSMIERLSQALRDLAIRASKRAEAETQVESVQAAQRQKAERDGRNQRQRLVNQFEEAKSSLEARLAADLDSVDTKSRQERVETDQALDEIRRREIAKHDSADEKARQLAEQSRWEATTFHEVSYADAKKRFEAGHQAVATARDRAFRVTNDASKLGRAYYVKFERPQGQTPPEGESPLPALEHFADQAELIYYSAERFFLVQLTRGAAIIPWLVLAVLAPIVWTWVRNSGQFQFNNTVGLAIGVGLLLACGLFFIARVEISRRVRAISQLVANLNVTADQSEIYLEQNDKKGRRDADLRKDQEILKADETLLKRKIELQRKRNQALDAAEADHRGKVAMIEAAREAQSQQLRIQANNQLQQTRQNHESLLSVHDQKHDKIARELLNIQEQTRAEMIKDWKDTVENLDNLSDRAVDMSREFFPDWHNQEWDAWKPATTMPPALRFGQFVVDRAQIPHGVTEHPQMRDLGRPQFTLPALMDFPRQSSVLINARDEGRDQATAFLQALMFRLLTATPPSKVRFTLIDPIGLGESFAAFMHLADYDEQLVTSRIWTDPHHIDQRLTDLGEHMENVIQKYLRNEFPSIVEYNQQAGEIAEPLRFLVVANFPANFNEQSARRLVSIAASGARCGVFTLMTVDSRQALPSGITLADFEPYATILNYKNGGFAWKHPDFGAFPLTLDSLPGPELVTRTLHHVGALAKEAKRVIVPFEIIAPKRENWWTSSAKNGVDVPLGRTGANKLQHMRLGEGTSQHVLIAGKTGSGKSTLLHALVTNAALRYSPNEVEMYLIDFKKGVEFKVYANLDLPHAKVVAIESEREFGLSVLQRLDEELRKRGDRFRDVGAQDLAGFRNQSPNIPMPRILLVVDEFQEFFVEDDRVAQDASLYLDRLVRQGRAFGIHVHLGSQTLTGAYSLARSTLGQMAVRVALQCSDTDAHLILSEDNTAARLLSRPGEAIYNDANGLIEGNNFFQVVWLSDEKREDYLAQIHQLARDRQWKRDRPQIVFEGNIPADVTRNHLIDQFVSLAEWPTQVRASQAWLGDAVAIKDPTSCAFRPQAGANLLLIGQSDDLAMGVMTSALLSLAAQHAPRANVQGHDAPPRFFILDGTPVDAPKADWFKEVASALPHQPRVGNWRDANKQIAILHREMLKRQETPDVEHPPLFLLVYGLQNFRDLRKQEDDFSFGRSDDDKPASASKLFGELLRDGSGSGIHTILWCDSLNNLYRSLERSALRDFDARVLFQMSVNDSSNLIDSPIANRLGANRALYHSEDKPLPEKFRPYGLPELDWVKAFGDKLRQRPLTIEFEPEQDLSSSDELPQFENEERFAAS